MLDAQPLTTMRAIDLKTSIRSKTSKGIIPINMRISRGDETKYVERWKKLKN